GAGPVPPGPTVLAEATGPVGAGPGTGVGGHRRPVPGPARPHRPGRGGVRRTPAGGDPMSRPVRKRATTLDSAAHHREWLSLVEISGPFLSLPVLRATWPSLDPLDKTEREQLRVRHAEWQADPAAGQSDWIRYVLTELLEWGDTLHETDLDPFPVQITEHDTQLTPSFALVTPGEKVTPESTRLLGLVCPPEQHPTGRIPDSTWAATPVDRLAHLCRHHRVELGLVTNGRFWVLVWAPRGKATAAAVFDAVDWPEAAERTVVRAFRSLLSRRRFFGVPPEQRLERLFADSADNQEEITEALGVQVRRAVELLVAALGRADRVAQAQGYPGLRDKSAHEVYRGAVAVM